MTGTQQTGKQRLLLSGWVLGVWGALGALRGQHLGTCSLCTDLSLASQFLTALEANYPEILRNIIIVRGE